MKKPDRPPRPRIARAPKEDSTAGGTRPRREDPSAKRASKPRPDGAGGKNKRDFGKGRPAASGRPTSEGGFRKERSADGGAKREQRSFDKGEKSASRPASRPGGERPQRQRDEGSNDRPARPGGQRAAHRADRPESNRPFRKEGTNPARPGQGAGGGGREERPFVKAGKRDEAKTDRPRQDRPFRKEGSAPRPTRRDDARGEDRPLHEEGQSSRPYGSGPADDKRSATRPDRPATARPAMDRASRPDRAAGKTKPFDRKPRRDDEGDKRGPQKNESVAEPGAPMTLNKYLAHAGISSRRDAASVIKEGKVTVNGEVLTTPGYRVQPGDKITFEGKAMTPQVKQVYVLLNKPKGYITTTDDEQDRRTVMDLVQSVEAERLYPVGRLDRNTTGLLLMTNDGDLAQRLTHPKYEAKKIYQVGLDKPLTTADFDKLIAGVELEDGPAKPDKLAYLDDKKELGIEIHSGRNRIVRRMFEALGYDVEKLDRVMFAGLTKKNVPRGQWRHLTEQEIVRLKHFKAER